MRNREYWTKRFTALEEAQLNKGAAYFSELENHYTRAAREVQKEINQWYARFAVNNEITLQEARKILRADELKEFKWSVKDYIKHGEENNISGQWAKQLENASARWHITRLDALKLQMQNHIEMLYGYEQDSVTRLMEQIYSDGYYHTAYELQKGFNIGYDLMKLDTRQIEKVISKPWAADGSNFSSRIWKQKTQLVSELHTELTQAIIRGQNPSKITDYISNRFGVSKRNAGRLVMTEAAFFASASTRDCFNDLGVERYEICATLDSHTSDTCQGLDGHVFKMSEYEIGVTAPPFHQWCRTTTVPYFDDEFELDTKRAARGEDGKVYYVPSDMKYPEWKKAFVDGGSKEGLENNPKSGNMKLGAGSSSTNGKTKRYELGQIDVKDTELAISEFSDQLRHLDVENAIVIDKQGNVVHFKGIEKDSIEVFDVDLDGATVIHNHPESNGIVSFGQEDFLFLRSHQNVKSLICCNAEYDYYVSVLEDISELTYNMFYKEALTATEYQMYEDMQHIVFDILKKKGYVRYERKRYTGSKKTHK